MHGGWGQTTRRCSGFHFTVSVQSQRCALARSLSPPNPAMTTRHRELSTADGTPPAGEPKANHRPALGGRAASCLASVGASNHHVAYGKEERPRKAGVLFKFELPTYRESTTDSGNKPGFARSRVRAGLAIVRLLCAVVPKQDDSWP